ncbi:hypothetical protein SAY87_005363 [Trapa incisa]|uniref:Uncharacterized protein n=1 Tax=Trapa incisa TaxID=236973 RepID=A0AAN7K4M0_9MYRT|nr:hypothetical protein SAY87_005363 [Trapa incisa]
MLARIHCSGIRNGIAKLPLFQLLGRLIMLSFSHLSLVFRICSVQKSTQRVESKSLLDFDNKNSYEITPSWGSQFYDDQLKGLIIFEGDLNLCSKSAEDKGEVSSYPKEKLSHMIRANMVAFEGTSKAFSGSVSGLVKRR